MCGIAGITRVPGAQLNGNAADLFLDLLQHRGPDDHGWLAYSKKHLRKGKGACDVGDAEAILLHRRLSILDLTEAGWQPMGPVDGRYYIVFNGEIYNHVELRAELEAKGRTFKSHSDTEVLLQAYAEWGKACLPRLIGMFAFAILDTESNKILLARDFFGIKPLFLARWSGGLAFSSEIEPLLSLPGITRKANTQALYDFLNFSLTDHGEQTTFDSIRQLRPGHWMEFSTDAKELPPATQFWELAERWGNHDLSFDDAAKELRELFLESVRIHLRSDVPIGAALSGGIDSSAIVMAMRHLAGKPLDLHTFSFIADHENLSEERWVDTVAAAAGARAHKIRANPAEVMQDLERLIRRQGEPFGSTSIYVQYRVFKAAHENGIKVMLDGQGADEMLGGYRGYLSNRLTSMLSRGQIGQAMRFSRLSSDIPNSEGRRMLLRACGAWVPRALKGIARRSIGERMVPLWLNENWLQKNNIETSPLLLAPGPDMLTRSLIDSVTRSSLPMLLRYEDRNSMAFSIESRVPFLTPQLANFIFSLPEEFLIDNDCTTKAVFRKAMRGIVPDEILDRRDKIGFATPEKTWLCDSRAWVESTLKSEAAASIPLLEIPAALAEWQRVLDGSAKFDFRIWRWLNVVKWCEQFSVTFE